ncbi:MAG: rod shape-determining protein MreC [Armatimonadetes bacterium]|nr:rod shape-determining protein MreC [Armatimonadota bacterium]MCX7968838.1 rod shape-determining protein MreC [Armatimonadota bacterium]MDW8143829.1 rod shape-determining protein MreC [Armatimonadota bacterium]
MAVRRSASRSQFAVLRAFLWGVIFSLALLLAILGGRTLLALPTDVISASTVKLVSAVSRFWSNLSVLPRQVLRIREINHDLSKLQSQLSQLQAEQWRVQELVEENIRLRKLLGLAHELAQPYIAAEVIAIGGSNWFHTIVVNKGSKDGIPQGAPVVYYNGLVGRIWETRPYHSIVLLLTDRHSAVGVSLTEHQGVYGIVKGTGKRLCELVHLSRHIVPEKGEVLVTSGLGGVFPKGIPVGEVVSVSVTTEPPTVKVKPFLQVNELREVIVLTKLPPTVNP